MLRGSRQVQIGITGRTIRLHIREGWVQGGAWWRKGKDTGETDGTWRRFQYPDGQDYTSFWIREDDYQRLLAKAASTSAGEG